MNREYIFRELRREFLKEVVLQSVLNFVLIFLSINLIFTLFFEFDRKPIVSLVISLASFLIDFTSKTKRFYIDIYEKKIPELREALRTAYEYKEHQGYIVNVLFSQIWKKLRKISSGEIVSLKGVVFKMVAISTLSVAIIATGFFELELPKIELSFFKNQLQVPDKGIELVEDSSIYGDKKIMNLGNESLELQINAFKNLMGNKEKMPDTQISTYKFPLYDPKAEESFEEKKIEDFGLVKKYNEILRGLE
jgi:hypothetical protein